MGVYLTIKFIKALACRGGGGEGEWKEGEEGEREGGKEGVRE